VKDTIDWQEVREIDKWLDGDVAMAYQHQPLAQDWGRVAKIAEELGEALEAMTEAATEEDYARLSAMYKALGRAISALILSTGQNPRKPLDPEAFGAMLDELADVAMTAILAIQHFTKDTEATRDIVMGKLATIYLRMLSSKTGEKK
jgi:NTP pyrophosphatase (non-canonical NTP hydrolase)